jgi:hypothetical protein
MSLTHPRCRASLLVMWRPNSTHHAAPDRVRQTWDFIQMLEHAHAQGDRLRAIGKHEGAQSVYSLFVEDDVEMCPDFFRLLTEAFARGDSGGILTIMFLFVS